MRFMPARTAVCTAADIECDLPAPRPPRNSQHHDRSGGGSCRQDINEMTLEEADELRRRLGDDAAEDWIFAARDARLLSLNTAFITPLELDFNELREHAALRKDLAEAAAKRFLIEIAADPAAVGLLDVPIGQAPNF